MRAIAGLKAQGGEKSLFPLAVIELRSLRFETRSLGIILAELYEGEMMV